GRLLRRRARRDRFSPGHAAVGGDAGARARRARVLERAAATGCGGEDELSESSAVALLPERVNGPYSKRIVWSGCAKGSLRYSSFARLCGSCAASAKSSTGDRQASRPSAARAHSSRVRVAKRCSNFSIVSGQLA